MIMRARRAGRVDAALLLSSLCATAIASEAPHNPYAPPRPAQGGAAGGYAAGGYAAGGYAGGYDENLWDVPPPPDAVAVLRPFRIATRGSAAFTFGLAAFRATSLADRARLLQLGPLGALAKPSFGLNAAAAALVAADRAPKVAAKALLYRRPSGKHVHHGSSFCCDLREDDRPSGKRVHGSSFCRDF